MKCPDCGTEMKPLATSVYCPNDCDRKVTEHIDPEKTEPIRFKPISFSSLLPSSPPDPLFGDADIDSWIDNLFDDGTD